MKLSHNTIIVTGGGSGIGRELARRWQAAGNTVIVAGRNMNNLRETIGDLENMYAYELDVANEESIESFAKAVIVEHPDVNVLVNNAGIMGFENITARREIDHAENVVNTNLLGPIRLINAFIDHLCAVKDAAIVNVTSGLAFVPLPISPTYSASKAAMHSYTQSLRRQLDGEIEVIEIAPPGVRTELNPGQSENEEYMPLDAFADEVMTLLQQEPTPSEILVEKVKPLRFAERDSKFDIILKNMPAKLN
ncbi:MAG: SDR family oxidoreductase [Candidatus Moraniibacteriota bacterium]|nr:MAG: SDR family oxidoreductase [Candidatus Moranbacteria bacterium]